MPITIEDFKQQPEEEEDADARQLRADLGAWADEALTQHRVFCQTFLLGCLAPCGRPADPCGPPTNLPHLAGVPGLREEIGVMLGVVVGEELRRIREVKLLLEGGGPVHADAP